MNRPSKPALALLTVAGVGHLRPASGTWGSMPPVILAGLLIWAGQGPGTWLYYAALALVLLVFALGCAVLGDHAEAIWGKDPSPVVADEVAGQCITLMAISPAFLGSTAAELAALLAAFLLFRFFDIAKPWPAGAMQKLPAGWGILLDDIFSGLQAGLVLVVAGLFV